MLKDRFNWQVTDLEAEHLAYGDTTIRVKLIGYFDKGTTINKSVTFDELREEIEYCLNDDGVSGHQQELTTYRLMLNSIYGSRGQYGIVPLSEVDRHCGLADYIDKVIFNDPATIVKWKDGTKTVVKVQDGETFDPMVGLAMCISKKAMGNQGNYFEVFKKYCEPWYEEQWKDISVEGLSLSYDADKFLEAVQKFKEGLGLSNK